MSKLVVLVDNYRSYNSENDTVRGFLKELTIKNSSSKRKLETEFVEGYSIKVYTKYKKIEVTGNIQSDNRIINIQPEDTYLVFSDRIKTKTMPGNVHLFASYLRIPQEDNVGNVHLLPLDKGYLTLSLKRVKDAIERLKLYRDITKLSEGKTLGDKVYNEVILALYGHIGRANKPSTIKKLYDILDRWKDIKDVGVLEEPTGIYTYLNNSVRGMKMNINNMLTYKGFKFFDQAIAKYEEVEKKIKKGELSYNNSLSGVMYFVKGVLSLMLGDEFDQFVRIISHGKEHRLLKIDENSDLQLNHTEIVLPHMEVYAGSVVINKHIYSVPKVTLYKEFTNKVILEYINDSHDFKHKDQLLIEHIYNADKYVKDRMN